MPITPSGSRNGCKRNNIERQLEFWKRQLEDAPALLEISTDFPRPAVQRYRGAKCSAYLTSDLSEKINALSRQEGVTLFMTLLSAWQLLLMRYSGQEQIIIGTPIAGRTKTETENLIGFFVNTLALRGDLSGDPTFRELLRRTRERALDAYTNQELPFDKLVEELNPERSLSYAPAVSSDVRAAKRRCDERKLCRFGNEQRKTVEPDGEIRFEPRCLSDKPSGLELQLEYDTDLFAEETAKQMLEHFRTILEAIAEDTDQRLTAFRC